MSSAGNLEKERLKKIMPSFQDQWERMKEILGLTRRDSAGVLAHDPSFGVVEMFRPLKHLLSLGL